MKNFEKDRFDKASGTHRVGAHRAVYKIGSRRVWFLFASLFTLLFLAIGILFIQLQPKSIKYSDELPENGSSETQGQPTAQQGVIDPDATVAILNGSEISDLAFFVEDEILSEGWGQVIFSGSEDKTDVAISAVFYGSKENESAAAALGQKLGGVTAYLGPEYLKFDNDLTILLGNDYKGPGLEAAKSGEHPNSGVLIDSDRERLDEELYDEFGNYIGEDEGEFSEDEFREFEFVDDGFVDEGFEEF